ncbi:MAG: hypothetical protein KAI70_00760 [Candidatus Omnitrophica bacterium]|nr:hypothetical protein [Candidatus Omnitrophota bacterium]
MSTTKRAMGNRMGTAKSAIPSSDRWSFLILSREFPSVLGKKLSVLKKKLCVVEVKTLVIAEKLCVVEVKTLVIVLKRSVLWPKGC